MLLCAHSHTHILHHITLTVYTYAMMVREWTLSNSLDFFSVVLGMYKLCLYIVELCVCCCRKGLHRCTFQYEPCIYCTCMYIQCIYMHTCIIICVVMVTLHIEHEMIFKDNTLWPCYKLMHTCRELLWLYVCIQVVIPLMHVYYNI